MNPYVLSLLFQIIVDGNTIRWPNGLTVDILDKKLYWADAKTKQISSCDYWGKNIRVVLHSHEHLRHPFSLAVFEERLYWTDWDREGVLSVNKFNGSGVKQVIKICCRFSHTKVFGLDVVSNMKFSVQRYDFGVFL